jgi:uncharacterized protein DUF4388
MALQGTLKDFSLADIFQLIGIQRKTGILTLTSQQETVTVAFVDGNVVGADSTTRRIEDRLGSVLVKTGKIGEAQLQEALRQQRSTLKRLGAVLVEGRFIDAPALSGALQVQVSQLVYRLFRWTAGEYRFTQEARVDYDREFIQPMSAESILMEGARILDEWPMIERGLRSMQSVFRHANVTIARSATSPDPKGGEDAAGAVTLSDQERQVHSLVDGHRTVQEIVDRSTIGEFETCRTLYELLGRQLIEEVATKAAVAPAGKRGTTAVPARATGGSGILAGLAVLLLVLLAGGGVLARSLPWLGEASQARGLSAWLSPFLTAPESRTVALSLGRSHEQRVEAALEVYYLLNRGYPQGLADLVTEGLVPIEALTSASGEPLRYEASAGDYRLSPGDS